MRWEIGLCVLWCVVAIVTGASVLGLPISARSPARPPRSLDGGPTTLPTTQPVTIPNTAPGWTDPLPSCPPTTRPEDPVGILAERVMHWEWWQGPEYKDCAWVDQRGRHWPPNWNPQRSINDAMQLVETILAWRMGVLQFYVRLESTDTGGWTCMIAPVPGCLPMVNQADLRRDGWGCTMPLAICAAAERWGADWVWFDIGARPGP